jgi:hypothetical protein
MKRAGTGLTPTAGRLAAFLAVPALLCLAIPAQAQYTRQITITVSSGAGGPVGTQTSFPMLVDVTDNDLKLSPTGSVRSASGYDIVFEGDAASCGGSPCRLDHELELYDGAAGRVVAWVRVPSLAAGRVVTMYYSNAAITSSTEARG